MWRFIETVATAILLLLVMIFILHLIQGDAFEWLTSKLRVSGDNYTKNKGTLPHTPTPNIPNDPLPPPPPNQG